MGIKSWHREIKDPKEAKENERVVYYPKLGLLALNTKDANYLKAQIAKKKVKQGKKADKRAKVQARLEIAYNRGLKHGAREFKKTEDFTKKLEVAFNKGVKSGKPSLSKELRITRKRDKIQKLQDELKSLESVPKAKVAKKAKAPVKKEEAEE